MKSEYNKGFIKLWRSIAQWHWWSDMNTSRMMIVLLLNVNWEDHLCNGIEIKRGSMLTSIRALAKMSGLSVQQTRTALKHLESTKDITITLTGESTHRCSLVTVENYDIWQGGYEKPTHQITDNPTQEATPNKEYIKNIPKEDNKNNPVVDSSDLMELLTVEDIKALYSKYEQAGDLIYLVQEQIDNGQTVIEHDAFKYICGYAKNKNWPYKGTTEV